MTFINPTAWLDLKILLAFCTFSFLCDPGLAVHFVFSFHTLQSHAVAPGGACLTPVD